MDPSGDEDKLTQRRMIILKRDDRRQRKECRRLTSLRTFLGCHFSLFFLMVSSIRAIMVSVESLTLLFCIASM